MPHEDNIALEQGAQHDDRHTGSAPAVPPYTTTPSTLPGVVVSVRGGVS